MCLTPETLKEIETSLVDFHKLTNNPLPMLKECFPQLSFVRMSAADIAEAPFRALADYNKALAQLAQQEGSTLDRRNIQLRFD